MEVSSWWCRWDRPPVRGAVARIGPHHCSRPGRVTAREQPARPSRPPAVRRAVCVECPAIVIKCPVRPFSRPGKGRTLPDRQNPANRTLGQFPAIRHNLARSVCIRPPASHGLVVSPVPSRREFPMRSIIAAVIVAIVAYWLVSPLLLPFARPLATAGNAMKIK